MQTPTLLLYNEKSWFKKETKIKLLRDFGNYWMRYKDEKNTRDY